MIYKLLLLISALVVANAKQPFTRSSLSLTKSSSLPSLTAEGKSRLLLTKRGGELEEDVAEEEDESSDDEEEEDDEGDDFDDFEGDDDEDDFGEANWLDQFIEAYTKTPPLTKSYLTVSAAITIASSFLNKDQFPEILSLSWKPVLRGQIWRPFTAFFNLGSFGVGYALTIQFVWQYMGTLERLNHNRPYDFWLMFLFGMVSITAGQPALKLNTKMLGHNLSTFFVYVWSRYHEGTMVNLFDLLTIQAEQLPWFFLAQTFLLEGEIPLLDILGIVFGHIYHHLKTIGMLRVPNFVVNWYQSSAFTELIRDEYKKITADFEVVPP